MIPAIILTAIVTFIFTWAKHKCESSRELAAHRQAERELAEDCHRRVYEASQRAFTQGSMCGSRSAEVERSMRGRGVCASLWN